MLYVIIGGKKRRVYEKNGSYYIYVTKRTKHNIDNNQVFESEPTPRKSIISNKLNKAMDENKKLSDMLERLQKRLEDQEEMCDRMIDEKMAGAESPVIQSPRDDDLSIFQTPRGEETLTESLVRGQDEDQVQQYQEFLQLKQELESLKEEKSLLERNLARRTAADVDTFSKLSQCTDTIAQYENEIKMLRASLIADNEEMSRKLEEEQRHMNEIQGKYEKLQEELGTHLRKSMERDDYSSQIEGKLETLEKNFVNLQHALETCGTELNTCKEAKNASINALEAEITKLINTSTEAETRLSKDLDTCKEDKNASINALEAEITKLINTSAEAETRLSKDLDTCKEDRDHTVRTLEQRIAESETKWSKDLDTCKEDKNASINALEAEIDKLINTSAEAETKWSKDLDDCKMFGKELNEQCSVKAEFIELIEKEKEKLHTENKNLKAVLNDLLDAIKNVDDKETKRTLDLVLTKHFEEL